MVLLVDSSIWIESSRPRTPESLLLRGLILSNAPLAICDWIRIEVSQGCRSLAESRKIWEYLGAFDLLDLKMDSFDLVEQFQGLRTKGIKIGTIDNVILKIARDHHAALWTLDKELKKAARHFGVETFRPQN